MGALDQGDWKCEGPGRAAELDCSLCLPSVALCCHSVLQQSGSLCLHAPVLRNCGDHRLLVCVHSWRQDLIAVNHSLSPVI